MIGIGDGIAIASVWAFACVSAASEHVPGAGVLVSLIIAIVMTIYLAG